VVWFSSFVRAGLAPELELTIRAMLLLVGVLVCSIAAARRFMHSRHRSAGTWELGAR
jgi:hypothetical protein